MGLQEWCMMGIDDEELGSPDNFITADGVRQVPSRQECGGVADFEAVVCRAEHLRGGGGIGRGTEKRERRPCS